MPRGRKPTLGNKPLTDALHAIFRPSTRRAPALAPTPKGRAAQALALRKRKNDPRVEVVSERLCNDVLEYIAPTLIPYRGCTLIDINPGACLWSKKLHHFLKPKRHILMEPEEGYMPFIQPLLDKRGSTYQHVALSGSNYDTLKENFDQLINDGFIPRKTFKKNNDPNLRKLDTSLLVTGNLARFVRARVSRHSSAIWSLQTLASSSLTNELFHRHGLVRTLFWLPEHDKWPFLPHINTYKTFHATSLGTSSSLNEVVAVQPATAYVAHAKLSGAQVRPRYSGFVAESAKQVSQRMKDSGITVPAGRALHGVPVPDDAAETEASTEPEPSIKTEPSTKTELVSNIELKSPFEMQHQTLEDAMHAFDNLAERIEKFVTASEGVSTPRAYGKSAAFLQTFIEAVKYPQLFDMVSARPKVKSKAKNAESTANLERVGKPGPKQAGPSLSDMRLVVHADLQLSLINFEAHCKMLEETGNHVASLESRINSVQELLTSTLGNSRVSSKFQQDIERIVEDTTSFFSSPPLLGSDQRQYEPLQAEPDDFWPRAHLCLFDITPIDRNLTAHGIADRREVANMWKILASYLFTLRSQPIASVLDKIAPNASKDLIPMVPAITDPRRGGRLDARHMKVRNLTEEMLVGLVKAWYEWPFRPETWELALSMTSDGPINTEALTPEAVTATDDE